MKAKVIPSFLSGLALTALASFTVLQLMAVALLVYGMTHILEIIGRLF